MKFTFLFTTVHVVNNIFIKVQNWIRRKKEERHLHSPTVNRVRVLLRNVINVGAKESLLLYYCYLLLFCLLALMRLPEGT